MVVRFGGCSADGLPVSTAHRLTKELVAWGFLERTTSKHYRVGTLMRVIGSQACHEPNVQERNDGWQKSAPNMLSSSTPGERSSTWY